MSRQGQRGLILASEGPDMIGNWEAALQLAAIAIPLKTGRGKSRDPVRHATSTLKNQTSVTSHTGGVEEGAVKG